MSSGGRVPPHNLEAERSILGAILVSNQAIMGAQEAGVESRDFYVDGHQKIFDVLQALTERGEAADLITVTAALKDRGWFDSIGGTQTLTQLFEDTFAVGNVQYYAKIVREKGILRRVIQTSGEIAAGAFSEVDDLEQFLNEAESKIFAVSENKSSKQFESLQEIMVRNVADLEKLATQNSDVIGLPTGFVDYDKLTGGLRGGQLIIIAARPGMGKTSWFLSAAQNIALRGEGVVAIFSMEMSKDELGIRFLAGASKIDSRRLKIGRLADRDWPRLVDAANKLSRAKVMIDDSGDLNVMDVRARCRRLKAREKKLDLIVVDYLQLMKGTKAASKGDSSREREISEISRNLKSLAKELNVPVIALSQLNRGVESRTDKRPMLSDLRESGAIEQDADMVCFIYRDGVYNKDLPDAEQRVAEFIVAKHRAGETATIRLAWLPEYTLFANLDQGGGGMPLPSGPRPDRGDITL